MYHTIELTFESGITLTAKVIPSYMVYAKMDAAQRITVDVPMVWAESLKKEVPHPNHPNYAPGVAIASLVDSQLAEQAFLRESFLPLTLRPQDFPEFIEDYQLELFPMTGDMDLDFVYWVIQTRQDQELVVNSLILTEQAIHGIFDMLSPTVYRQGVPIMNAGLKHSVNTGLDSEALNIFGYQIVHPLTEYDVCKEAGINLIEWGKLDLQEKAAIVAMQRLSQVVDMHKDDAVQIESSKKSKS